MKKIAHFAEPIVPSKKKKTSKVVNVKTLPMLDKENQCPGNKLRGFRPPNSAAMSNAKKTSLADYAEMGKANLAFIHGLRGQQKSTAASNKRVQEGRVAKPAKVKQHKRR